MEKGFVFTLGRLGEIQQLEDNRLSETYGKFIAAYGAICEPLNRITEDVLGGDLNAITKIHVGEEIVDRYIDEYESYISAIDVLVERNGLRFQDVNFASFIESARNIVYTTFEKNPYQQNVMLMQFVSATSQIVEFLHHIEEAITHRSPIFKYMEIGAKILDYKDRKMFRKMYNAIQSVGENTIAKSILEVSLRNNTEMERHNYHYYGERVAMADYSYSFKTKHYPSVMIEPVELCNSILNANYNNNNCSIKLGLGQQMALFKTPDRKGNIVLSFAGTQKLGGRSFNNYYTDICQITHGPETSYLAAVGVLSEVAKAVEGQIKVVGHSLGGGLMQYACAAIDDDRIWGTGFNSAGLSNYSCHTLTSERIMRNRHRIQHICAVTDPISKVGTLLGRTEYVRTGYPLSHSLGTLNKILNGEKISCYMR